MTFEEPRQHTSHRFRGSVRPGSGAGLRTPTGHGVSVGGPREPRPEALHFGTLAGNYLLPLSGPCDLDREHPALELDPLSKRLAASRNWLHCLHPRDREALEERAAAAQSSQLQSARGLAAEQMELRRVAKIRTRKLKRIQISVCVKLGL